MNKPKLRLIELFNGISAQYRGMVNTDLFDVEMVATSDIDKDVIVQCAAIHCGLTQEMIENYPDYPSKEEMVKSLIDRNIGYSFEKNKMYDWEKLAKKKKGMDLEKYWLAAKLTNNLGDVSKIDKLPECDVLTFSSPCTDYSIAGKQEGAFNTCNKCGCKFNPFDYDVENRYNCPECGSDDIQGTRSGLLKEVERLLINSINAGEAPMYLLQENVDALVSKKFKPDFDAFCRRLENLNYSVYYTVLNAKECGIPQNRRRLFMIGIRKDIDNGTYTFPLPFDTGIRLKDILEKNVDEKYYIDTERAENLIKQLVEKGQLKEQRVCCNSSINDPNVTPILVKNQGTEYVKTLNESVTLKARDWKGWDNYGSTAIVEETNNQNRLGGLWDGDTKHQAGSVWDKEGVCPTLDTMQGGGREPHIIENKEYIIYDDYNSKNIKDQNNIGTLTTNCGNLTLRNGTKLIEITKPETVWKDISSRYKISNHGVVADIVNKCKVEVIDGKIELEVKDIKKSISIDSLINKFFPEQTHENSVIVQKVGDIKFESNDKSKVLGKLEENSNQRRVVYDKDTLSPTLQAAMGTGGGNVPLVVDNKSADIEDSATAQNNLLQQRYRIRKLTPRECFVLMGFTFEDVDKCYAVGISNSALYKAAGNSIVTNCISLLFEHLYKAQYDSTYICTDEKIANFHQPQTE